MYRISKNSSGEYVAIFEGRLFRQTDILRFRCRDPIISEDWEIFQRELKANVEKISQALSAKTG